MAFTVVSTYSHTMTILLGPAAGLGLYVHIYEKNGNRFKNKHLPIAEDAYDA